MNNFIKIGHVEVPAGGQSAIEFNPIPATYTDLLIKCSLRSTRADLDDLILLKPNNSSSNLSYRYLRGDGSGTATDTTNRLYICGNTTTANTFGNAQIYISNYSGTTNKAIIGDFMTENNAVTSYSSMHSILWSDNSVISSIVLNAIYGNFVQYSSATLYGITKGSSGGVTVS